MRKKRVKALREALRAHDNLMARIEPGKVDLRIATFTQRFKRLKKEYRHGKGAS